MERLLGNALLGFILLLVRLIISAEAVDIIALDTSDCSLVGGEQVCQNLPPADCCIFYDSGIRSVLCRGLPVGSLAIAYVGGACAISTRNPVSGPGDICLPTLSATGAGYFTPATPTTSKCSRSRRPNGILYSTDSSGYWVADADPETLLDVQSEFRDLPTESKLGWLKSRGARYVIASNSTGPSV